MSKRKSTRLKSKKSFDIKKILALFIPVVLVAFIIFNNQSSEGVLGISDFNVSKKVKPSISPNPSGACKPIKINSVSFTAPCEGEKMGFQSVSYTCADNSSGTLTAKSCGNPQDLFEKVKKACNKNSTCKPSPTKVMKKDGKIQKEVTKYPTEAPAEFQ